MKNQPTGNYYEGNILAEILIFIVLTIFGSFIVYGYVS